MKILKVINKSTENVENTSDHSAIRKQITENKKFLLNDSKSFCILPWVTFYKTPIGEAGPCCVMNMDHKIKVEHGTSLKDMVNCNEMKQLRLDMLNEVKNPICSGCHAYEENNVQSPRQNMNKEYGAWFHQVEDHTNSDGSLCHFQMRYFDIRFSNLCNFKCRTCNSSYSSQWAKEDQKYFNYSHVLDSSEHHSNEYLLDEILEHTDSIAEAYFAGGEPLINEQHYIILENFIRKGRTNIILKYNSNTSNLIYKDKDIFDLWSRFDRAVLFSASIDHYGERAEYIRHGTDWGKVENNLHKLRKNQNVLLAYNIVFSAFNCLSLREFFNHLKSNDLLDDTVTVYPMSHPEYLSAQILPDKFLSLAKDQIMHIAKDSVSPTWIHSTRFRNDTKQILSWLGLESKWEQHKTAFKAEICRLDYLRNENFVETFPELKELMIL